MNRNRPTVMAISPVALAIPTDVFFYETKQFYRGLQQNEESKYPRGTITGDHS